MKTVKIFSFALLSVVALSGCSISFKTADSGGNDGGLYKSENKGESWLQRTLIPTTSGRPGNIGRLDAQSLAIDPSDAKALYLGTVENGLFYSYDGARGWLPANSLGKITVRAIAVNPKEKCVLYVSAGNKVFKSTDCSRTWAQVYYDNDPTVSINTIAIDHYDPAKVYIGSERGEVIRSLDQGLSWQTIGRFDNSVEKIAISPHDSRLLFAATAKKGVFRLTGQSEEWENLNERLKEYRDSKSFRDLAFSVSDKGLVFLATNYGLLKSKNNGDNWEKIELITPEKDALIYSLAVSPKNALEIYYVTGTTFYRSLDGGANWTTKKLPTARAGWRLAIDQDDPSVVYMSVKTIKK